MSLPRLIYRTHYQAVGLDLIDLTLQLLSPSEPANVPAASEHISRVAAENNIKINSAAVAYLLGNMRQLGLLNRDNAVANDAVAYYILTKSGAPIDPTGRVIFYFVAFLRADGSLLIPFLESLRDADISLPAAFHSTLFEDILRRVLDYYADHAGSPQDYAKVRRQREELLAKPLAWKTRKHKLLFHLEALDGLKLASSDKAKKRTSPTYRITSLGRSLLDFCPTLEQVERSASTTTRLMELAGEVYGSEWQTPEQSIVLDLYKVFAAHGFRLVTVDQLCWANVIIHGKLWKPTALEDLLKEMRQRAPDLVRLHAYRGRNVDSFQINPELLASPATDTLGSQSQQQ